MLILALNQSSTYPLVAIANRDEEHTRPSAPADRWLDQPGIIGGRDLLRGGTWLAFDRNGRFGAVTNFRDGDTAVRPRSRGDLITNYLRADQPAKIFCNDILPSLDEYAGFNLIVGEIGKPFRYQSNRSSGQQLASGIFGISNGHLDNQWPKVVRGKTQLQRWLETATEPDLLFDILTDRNVYTNPNAGPSADAAATAFIVNSAYGTRASTCILVGANGEVVFEERRFDPQGQSIGSSSFEFSLAS